MALRGTLTLRKTRRLAAILKIDPPCAMGLLEALWHVTAEQQRDGGIGRFTNQDIADEMFYTGDPDALIEALLSTRWIDKDQGCRLYVHDWHEHCDDTTDSWLARHGKTYATGHRPRMRRLRESERQRLCAKWGWPLPKTCKEQIAADTDEDGGDECAIHTHGAHNSAQRADLCAQNTAKHANVALPEPVPEPVPEPEPVITKPVKDQRVVGDPPVRSPAKNQPPGRCAPLPTDLTRDDVVRGAIARQMADEIVHMTGDRDSHAMFVRIVTRLPRSDVLQALSELKESRASPNQARKLAAIFVHRCNEMASARGIDLWGHQAKAAAIAGTRSG